MEVYSGTISNDLGIYSERLSDDLHKLRLEGQIGTDSSLSTGAPVPTSHSSRGYFSTSVSNFTASLPLDEIQ